MSFSGWSLVVAMGLINFLATYIVTDSRVTEDLRNFVKFIGRKVKGENSSPDAAFQPSTFRRIRRSAGDKIQYFATCALCVGTWMGIVQAAFFEGPLQLELSWMTVLANGLLYKAVGHFFLQANGLLHNLCSYLHAAADVRLGFSRSIPTGVSADKQSAS